MKQTCLNILLQHCILSLLFQLKVFFPMDNASHTAFLLQNGAQQAQGRCLEFSTIPLSNPNTAPAQWNILTGPAVLTASHSSQCLKHRHFKVKLHI